MFLHAWDKKIYYLCYISLSLEAVDIVMLWRKIISLFINQLIRPGFICLHKLQKTGIYGFKNLSQNTERINLNNKFWIKNLIKFFLIWNKINVKQLGKH